MAAKKQHKIKVQLTEPLTPSEKIEVANEIIELIIERTKAGLDKRNKGFKEYTKEYAEKKGVGRGKVDLTLFGSMLESLQLLNESDVRGKRPRHLLIGFEKGSTENAKAEGSILGTYGQKQPIKGKKRDFLGVFKYDVQSAIDRVTSEREEAS